MREKRHRIAIPLSISLQCRARQLDQTGRRRQRVRVSMTDEREDRPLGGEITTPRRDLRKHLEHRAGDDRELHLCDLVKRDPLSV